MHILELALPLGVGGEEQPEVEMGDFSRLYVFPCFYGKRINTTSSACCPSCTSLHRGETAAAIHYTWSFSQQASNVCILFQVITLLLPNWDCCQPKNFGDAPSSSSSKTLVFVVPAWDWVCVVPATLSSFLLLLLSEQVGVGGNIFLLRSGFVPCIVCVVGVIAPSWGFSPPSF